MTGRTAHGWQLILADLALILFLVTLSALASEDANAPGNAETPIAPAQALYRPGPQAPSLRDWLAERPRDPRATLTIFAQHSEETRERVWEEAQLLAGEAEASGFAVRVVLTRGSRSDLHASLAYDLPRDES